MSSINQNISNRNLRKFKISNPLNLEQNNISAKDKKINESIQKDFIKEQHILSLTK